MNIKSYESHIAWVIYGLIIAALTALNALQYFQTDFVSALKNRDFSNYWLAGQLIQEGREHFLFGDIDTYMTELNSHMGQQQQTRYWSYPPHYLFFIIPLGYLSYFAAMTAFLASGFAIFTLSARAYLGGLDAKKLALLIPFSVCILFSTQNGFITGALFLLALHWRDHRPVLAGIMLGLLTIKPQLGLLLPVLFLLEKRYLAIFSASVTCALAIFVSILVFGWDNWLGYIQYNLPYMKIVMWEWQGSFLKLMPSWFASMRVWGAESATALAAHMLFALAALSVTALYRKNLSTIAQRSIVVTLLTFLVMPYFYVYDVGPLVVVSAAILSRQISERVGFLSSMVALLPLACLPMGLLHLAISPLMIFALLLAVLVSAGNTDPSKRQINSSAVFQ